MRGCTLEKGEFLAQCQRPRCVAGWFTYPSCWRRASGLSPPWQSWIYGGGRNGAHLWSRAPKIPRNLGQIALTGIYLPFTRQP